MNTSDSYPELIPIMIDWLEHLDGRVSRDAMGPASYDKFREGLVRSLTVPYARPFPTHLLVREYWKPRYYEGTRAAIGMALALLATAEYLDDMLAIATAPELTGSERAAVIGALGKKAFRSPKARAALVSLLEQEPDLAGFTIHALIPYHARETVPTLQRIASDAPDAWLRNRAARALERLAGAVDGRAGA